MKLIKLIKNNKITFILISVIVVTLLVLTTTLISLYRESTITGEDNDKLVFDPSEQNIIVDDATGVSYVNNAISVIFIDRPSDDRKAQLSKRIQGELVAYYQTYDMYIWRIENSSYTKIKALAKDLKAEEDIIVANPIIMYNAFNNATIATQSGNGTWWRKAIQLDEALSISKVVQDIPIGVVDDSVKLDHPALNGAVSVDATLEELNEQQISKYSYSHGTGVCSFTGSNGKVADIGVYFDANIIMQPLKIYGNHGFLRSNVVEKYGDAIQSGAKVINLSLGSAEQLDEESAENEALLFISIMIKGLENGQDFITVQASGNGDRINGDDYNYDALYGGIISYSSLEVLEKLKAEKPKLFNKIEPQDIFKRIIIVGNAKEDGKGGYVQHYTSNGGDRVNICAPGTDIKAAAKDNGYKTGTGTSYASPIVAGVTALSWANNPALSGAQVFDIVTHSTNTHVADNADLRHATTNSYQMVNAFLSIKAAQEANPNNAGLPVPPPTAPSPPPTTQPNPPVKPAPDFDGLPVIIFYGFIALLIIIGILRNEKVQ